MDPPTGPTLMNKTPPYNLSEIWPMSINGGGGAAGDGLDLRRGPLMPNMTRFSEPGPNRDSSSGDAVVNGGGAAARKRRENKSNNHHRHNLNNSSSNVMDDDSAKGMSDSDSKRLRSSGSGDDTQNQKADGEVNSAKGSEQKSKNPSEPPKDYIHVRARRGQATDSHSLAERARREKISERMRILQELVPGCNKVIGKALVLDEIINYIQSLQRQVEFLSMKLEAVNTRISPGIEGFPSKDFGQQPYDASGVGYCSQTPREYGRGASPDWLHMQIGGGFQRQT